MGIRGIMDLRGWLIAFFLAAGAHAGVFQTFSGLELSASTEATSPVVSISLVTAPVEPVQPKPKPEPVVPAPLPEPVVERVKPKPLPVPRPAVQAPAPVKSRPVPVPAAQAISAEKLSEPLTVAARVPLELPRADAAYLRNPPPVYPRRLLRRGVEGTVLVRAEVQDDGRCSQVSLKESSGFRLLDEAALDAVRDWQFVPARKGAQTVVAWVDVPIEFRITKTR